MSLLSEDKHCIEGVCQHDYDMSKILRTQASGRRERLRKFAVDLLTDGKPVECMQKQRNVFFF